MSAQAHRLSVSSGGGASLEQLVDAAGALRVVRADVAVVVSHGSAAGELAACMSAVGVCDSSHLAKLVVEGRPEAVRTAVSALTGFAVAPGGALSSAGVWWCAETAGRMIVVGPRSAAERLRSVLATRMTRRAAVTVGDRTDDWAALTVVGRRAASLLSTLGVYGPEGDPRSVAPVRHHPVGGADAVWVLESDARALAIVARGQAGTVWQAIMGAGRGLGICAVGQDAVDRFALLTR